MGVQGGPTGLRPGVLGAEQGPQFGALAGEAIGVVVEHLGHGAPSSPAGEHPLFVLGRPPVVGSALFEDA